MRRIALVAFVALGCGGGSEDASVHDAMPAVDASALSHDAPPPPDAAPTASIDAQAGTGVVDAPSAPDATMPDAAPTGLVWDVGAWDQASWQ